MKKPVWAASQDMIKEKETRAKPDTKSKCAVSQKILETFWNKKGWKYKQYRKQLEFIKQDGYNEFLKRADKWKGPHGKL